ncbi:hypothetical protein L9F63_004593, partial [Diploptera punctata]
MTFPCSHRYACISSSSLCCTDQGNIHRTKETTCKSSKPNGKNTLPPNSNSSEKDNIVFQAKHKNGYE